jgi:hypothetical protein
MYFLDGNVNNFNGPWDGVWNNAAYDAPADGKESWPASDDDGFGAVSIVVVKIQWDADIGGEDIISLARFLETDTISEAAFDQRISEKPNLSTANWTANKPNLDQSQFDLLNIAGVKFFVDEIRIATTFEEAVPTSGTPTPRPTISTVTPASGPLAGGTAVTITGTNLTSAATATIGGKALVALTVTEPDTITGTTPAGDAAGAVDVVVSDAGGTATLAGGFTYEEDGGPIFRRGDSNADGGVNIADAIYTLQRLFAGGDPILCLEAADANDDDSVNIADAVYVLQRLFAGGDPIPPPGPDACGPDETLGEGKTDLGCEGYPAVHCEGA